MRDYELAHHRVSPVARDGDTALAIENYKQALELNPNNTGPALVLPTVNTVAFGRRSIRPSGVALPAA
jgi:hypothetical protein